MDFEKKGENKMKRLFLLASLILLMSACEIHNYPDGSTMYKFPEPEISVVFEPEPEVVVVESPHSVVVVPSYYPSYENYCEAYPSDCCVYYEYYDLHTHWEVCEIRECYDRWAHTYFVSDQYCWYE